jgi:hypothetical protein
MQMHLRLQAARQQLYGASQGQHVADGISTGAAGCDAEHMLLLTGLLNQKMLLPSQEPEHGHQLSLI